MDWIAENKKQNHAKGIVSKVSKHPIDTLDTTPLAHSEKSKLSVQLFSASNEKAIRAWLTFIGEHDLEMIDDVLDRCRTDPEALSYFLLRACEVPETESPELYGQRQCAACSYWRGNYCQALQHQRRDDYGRSLPYTPDPNQYWRCPYHSAAQTRIEACH